MSGEKVIPLEDGTLYSKRKGFTPLHVPPLKEYAKIVGEEPIKELEEVSERLSGIKMLELSSTPYGGGVAEMLHSSVPFLNSIGIEDEWKVIKGSKEFFEVTKTMHHLLQGKKGELTTEAEKIYFSAIKENVAANIIDYEPDVVFVHDPQPLALARELKSGREKWIWRCHIDINGYSLRKNLVLWDFINLLDRCFRRPEWHEKVVFILKIAPSRTKVGQYRVLKQEIDELVGRINGKGVLILSEMAGAARELGEALVVNSNNKEEVAEALNEALRMPEEEQKSRNEEMQKRLSHYDVFHWGSGFIRSVLETKRLQEELNMKKLNEKIREELKNRKHDFIWGHQRK